KKPKERILDFIAVRQLKERLKGPILCFVGPPGTGKTSLGKSVARALGREFIRVSLGGVRDEAEIRGHRKTYVGALPGKIIQSMKKVGTSNPVFLLDEIDKISSDFRGDPASALLEVLDPEQNHTFVDHYLEVPYDLSAVMFIATANSMYNIPYALRDRMEIIEIPGYTDLEKVRIAQDFIIPKQLRENGLEWADIRFQQAALLKIIRGYTMESGVRNLEREIAAVIRKIAREAIKKGYTAHQPADGATGGGTSGESKGNKTEAPPEAPFVSIITPPKILKHLGNPRFQGDLVYNDSRPGLAHGLAWTEIGGTLLPVEVAVLDGPGDLILTGSLGDVMKESARTALSFIKVHYRRLGLRPDFAHEKDIHIHVPEGAIPKDGPSAGITLAAALLSAFIGAPVAKGYAMTGEITLTGRILPIGGVKEKVLAAYRNKMSTVVMPEGNRKDIDELPKEVRNAMKFYFSDSALDALLTLVR
ncbi:MAG TPA: endopeptidase La, partial [Spirochaetia bacterium]|nr:endopeptidase La [Spirochaetia bacterium]